MQETLNYINENKQRFVDELFELLKIASISADPAYKDEVLKCADEVAKHLKNAGADRVEVCQTKGYPIVFGQNYVIHPRDWTVMHLRKCETMRQLRLMNLWRQVFSPVSFLYIR